MTTRRDTVAQVRSSIRRRATRRWFTSMRVIAAVGFAAWGWAASPLIAAPAPPAHDDAPPVKQIICLVKVPGARTLAINDKLGLLVVGHPVDDATMLSIFHLDDHGQLVKAGAEATSSVMTLPRPKGLDDYASYPLAMTFNPKRPVLYIWQDIAAGLDKKDDGYQAARSAIEKQFHHLVIFQADKTGLTKLGAYCAGDAFALGQNGAAITVSRDGERLFIPNLYGTDDPDTSWLGGIGYFDLDDQGRPVPVRVPLEGTLDGYGVSKFEMRIKPVSIYTGFRRATNEGRYMTPLPTCPSFAPTKRIVAFGTRDGIGVWDTQDPREQISDVGIRGSGSRGHFIVGAPHLPLIYAAQDNGDVITRIEHVDGIPTLMPKLTTITQASGAGFQSPPVVFDGKYHGLAIVGRHGRTNRIYLIALDDKGRLTGEVHRLELPDADDAPVLGYSPRYDRLYVVVSKLPPTESDKESSP